jgi:diaminopropionate ammonia-lyase
MCEILINPFRQAVPSWEAEIKQGFSGSPAGKFHRLLPEYKPTPLVTLPNLAEKLSIGSIFVKDESFRFGLKAFKVLGASYAIYRFLKQQWGGSRGKPLDIKDFLNDSEYRRLRGFFTFCTATDGNHGRAVAWTARKFSQRAVIYMPAGTVPARVKNIEAEGARVIIIDGDYDAAVKQAANDAAKHHWIVISDTAYEGYLEIPKFIMAGYITMFQEMEKSLHKANEAGIDLVILQGGVGSFAAAAVWYYVNRYDARRPKIICVEPAEAACLFASVKSPGGKLSLASGNFKTMMAGLNCGTPSLLAWPILRTGVDAFLTISDDFAAKAMRLLYHPIGDDPRITSGESGAAGMGALVALLRNQKLAQARGILGINSKSRILIFNTEGDTDPENFKRVVYN